MLWSMRHNYKIMMYALCANVYRIGDGLCNTTEGILQQGTLSVPIMNYICCQLHKYKMSLTTRVQSIVECVKDDTLLAHTFQNLCTS